MLTETPTPPETHHDSDSAPGSPWRELIGRVTRLELIVGAVIAAVMVVLVLAEPEARQLAFQDLHQQPELRAGPASASCHESWSNPQS